MAITKATASSVAPAAAGDLVYGSGTNDAAVLALGTAGQVLTVNSGATAPEWATPAGGGDNFTLLNTGGTSLSGATTTVSGISGKDKLLVILDSASSASADSIFYVQFNTGGTYKQNGAYLSNPTTYGTNLMFNLNAPEIYLGGMSNNAGSVVDGYVMAFGCNSAGLKVFLAGGAGNASSGNGQTMRISGGTWNGSSAVTSVSVKSLLGNFDAGTVYVYGA